MVKRPHNENEVNSQLVFVIGAGRSGTTLLMNMLNEHSDIVAPPEHDFLISSLNRFGNTQKMSERDINIFIKNLWNRKTEFRQLWKLDDGVLRKSLIDGGRSFSSVFINTLKAYDSEKSPKLVIDKNPYYTANIELLTKCFPDAKFIAMVRDVRDRLVSIKRNESAVFKNGILRSAKWTDFNQNILTLKNDRPSDVCVLKYEELVLNPQKTLSDLCSFFDLSIDESMLNYDSKSRMKIKETGVIEYAMNKMHQNSSRELNPNKIGEWKSELSEIEIKELSFFCGAMAHKLGYEDFPELSLDEQIQIKKKYRKAIVKGRFLWKLKAYSYRLPLGVQRILSRLYRKVLAK